MGEGRGEGCELTSVVGSPWAANDHHSHPFRSFTMTVDQQDSATSTATEATSSTSPSSSLRRSGSRSPLVELSSTLSGVRESFASGLKTLQHSKLPKGVELK